MQEAYIAVQIDKELIESDLERASMQREDYLARLMLIESRRCPGIASFVVGVNAQKNEYPGSQQASPRRGRYSSTPVGTRQARGWIPRQPTSFATKRSSQHAASPRRGCYSSTCEGPHQARGMDTGGYPRAAVTSLLAFAVSIPRAWWVLTPVLL